MTFPDLIGNIGGMMGLYLGKETFFSCNIRHTFSKRNLQRSIWWTAFWRKLDSCKSTFCTFCVLGASLLSICYALMDVCLSLIRRLLRTLETLAPADEGQAKMHSFKKRHSTVFSTGTSLKKLQKLNSGQLVRTWVAHVAPTDVTLTHCFQVKV